MPIGGVHRRTILLAERDASPVEDVSLDVDIVGGRYCLTGAAEA